ncbi:hypothetical protein SGUI_1655 [Serinicoccus hydrothermalis]|uniref:Antitoxin n=1 Tax=Serinicoccus hydrothermalis TaxID=1758689 RepID=A0A1B1NCD1_9MICO|nr:hypothetical protein [Serinicoccus hydrothermalis]ANS79051.1 hypothetical protein SGUI_1655 [Serinicoccus hydrothermalis]
MRTTITLDPDVAALVEREMAARDIRFKQAVNDALRRQLGGEAGVRPLVVPARDLGPVSVDLGGANRVADELEDEALVRKLAEGR